MVAWNFWKKSFHKDKPTKAIRTQLEKALPRLRVPLLACFPPTVLWLFSFRLVSSASLRSAGSCAAAAEGCSMRTVHSVPLLDAWEAASSRCKFKHTDRQRCPPRVARTNTKTKAYLYHLLSRSYSLWWSFKARGVSVVQPLLLSFRCMSSSVNLSSFSVPAFSLTSLPVCPRFLFSFSIFFTEISPRFFL